MSVKRISPAYDPGEMPVLLRLTNTEGAEQSAPSSFHTNVLPGFEQTAQIGYRLAGNAPT